MKIKRFEFNMFPENCYVLWDETNEAVVIDPGCFYEEEKQALKNFIIKNGLNVKHLLNTHLHLDHIFGNPFMLKEFGLKAEANQADEFWIDEAPKQSRMFGFQLQEAPVPLGTYLHDGDIITFGNTKLEAIHVPGHSPGSLVYYCAADHCMFSGGCAVSRQHRPCRPCRRQLRRTDRAYLQPSVHPAQRHDCLSRTRSTDYHRNRKSGESVLPVNIQQTFKSLQP